MSKLLILLAVIAALIAVVAGSANAASQARDPRVPALQRQVAVLTSALSHEIDLGTCRWTYQSHFNYGVLNIFAIMIGEAQTADQTPSDNGACSRVGLTPPRAFKAKASPFDTLIGLQDSLLQLGA